MSKKKTKQSTSKQMHEIKKKKIIQPKSTNSQTAAKWSSSLLKFF